MEIDSNNGEASRVFKALASKTRLRIMNLLSEKQLDISRIAEAVKQTEANISAQVKILEKAGLIVAEYKSGEHGVSKLCRIAAEKLIIKFI